MEKPKIRDDLKSVGLPAVVDRATWQAERDALLGRERRTPAKVTRSRRPAVGS